MRDQRIDAYIAKAQPFAQPILSHLRELIHAACPRVEETIKWSFPNFIYKGAILCNMAAFKEHMAFGFWKASIMDDPHGILTITEREAMGHMGQIRSLKDLPKDKILKEYIKQAARLNEHGVKAEKKIKSAPKELEVPDYLLKAIKKNKAAFKTFEGFSTTNKREYVDWITEAKTDATRDKRMAQAIEWMAEGKIRNWKYLKK
ncbi:MAG: YdeI/OmpD-associated family protein [Bacteroidetes bacterium]|nr:YdeI/OmpD-associated family protein [Bacteroidota bacterium]